MHHSAPLNVAYARYHESGPVIELARTTDLREIQLFLHDLKLTAGKCWHVWTERYPVEHPIRDAAPLNRNRACRLRLKPGEGRVDGWIQHGFNHG